jgi:hypothetical protein
MASPLDAMKRIKAAQEKAIADATPAVAAADPELANLFAWAQASDYSHFDGTRQRAIKDANITNVKKAIERLKAVGLSDYLQYNSELLHDLAVNLARSVAIFQSMVGDTAGGSAYYAARSADLTNQHIQTVVDKLKDSVFDPTATKREGFFGEGGIGKGSKLLTTVESAGSTAIKGVTGGMVDVDLTKLGGNSLGGFVSSLKNVGGAAIKDAVSKGTDQLLGNLPAGFPGTSALKGFADQQVAGFLGGGGNQSVGNTGHAIGSTLGGNTATTNASASEKANMHSGSVPVSEKDLRKQKREKEKAERKAKQAARKAELAQRREAAKAKRDLERAKRLTNG